MWYKKTETETVANPAKYMSMTTRVAANVWHLRSLRLCARLASGANQQCHYLAAWPQCPAL